MEYGFTRSDAFSFLLFRILTARRLRWFCWL